MSNPFAVARKYLSVEAQQVEPVVIERDTIQAVKICSQILGDEIWLIFDRDFIQPEGLASYYAEEIPLLKNKTPEELRNIQRAKLTFPDAA
jgi:hypothetical protein